MQKPQQPQQPQSTQYNALDQARRHCGTMNSSQRMWNLQAQIRSNFRTSLGRGGSLATAAAALVATGAEATLAGHAAEGWRGGPGGRGGHLHGKLRVSLGGGAPRRPRRRRRHARLRGGPHCQPHLHAVRDLETGTTLATPSRELRPLCVCKGTAVAHPPMGRVLLSCAPQHYEPVARVPFGVSSHSHCVHVQQVDCCGNIQEKPMRL